ncbi:MAG: helix-turn-helix transcriptional regulator [Balneolaceae bacterium]
MTDKAILQDINDILSASKHKKNLRELYTEKRDSLELSDNQISDVLGIQYKSLMRILNNEAQKIDYVTLYKFSRFLNVDIEELGKIYMSDDSETVVEIDLARRNTYIVENFDLKDLKNIGLIKSVSNLREIEKRLLDFFQFEKITDYDGLMTGVMFSKTKLTPHDKMRSFWVKSAHALFKKIDNPNDYLRSDLVDLIPKIRPYTQNVRKGFLIVAQALYNIGITVIFQRYLTNTQVRGGTFFVNGKPCIVITDFNKSYPTLWFALIHELYHVLYDLDRIQKNIFHLTGEPDMLLIEEEKANDFAREFLFSNEKTKFIASLIHNHVVVSNYAKESQVHPSLIYAFFQHDKSMDGEDYWGAFRDHIPKSDIAVEHLNLVPWEKETIDQSVEELKEILIKFV